MRNLKGIKTVLIVLLLVSSVFYVGFRVGDSQVPEAPSNLPEEADLSLLWDVWEELEKKYPESLDYQEMIYGAASGMVRSLGDPYTVFFNPEQSKMFREDISGFFDGVGMEIGITDEMLTVIAPLKNTPAEKAGLRAGDKILQIEDVFTKSITIEEAVKLIRGEKGTEVQLTILRKEWDSPREIKITRDRIKIPTIEWELKEEDIAYIKLYQFSQNVNSDFREVASAILESPAQKIILDLRNNPGGLLDKAQDIAGWFLKRGDMVVIEDFGGKREQIGYRAMGNETFLNYEIVVLINKGSASGAEILAAALRDNRQVKLIGVTSFGKGSVQEPVGIRGGSTLKVTVGKWLTPNGDFITDVGLTPDIEIEITEEDYEHHRDPQLDKAIEVLSHP